MELEKSSEEQLQKFMNDAYLVDEMFFDAVFWFFRNHISA